MAQCIWCYNSLCLVTNRALYIVTWLKCCTMAVIIIIIIIITIFPFHPSETGVSLCRWHAEVLGWEDYTTEQVVTMINLIVLTLV